MKTSRFLPAILLAGFFLVSAPPPAQTQVPAQGVPTQSSLQALQALKAGNDKLLERQKATLQQLDEVSEQARQLRIFSKRT